MQVFHLLLNANALSSNALMSKCYNVHMISNSTLLALDTDFIASKEQAAVFVMPRAELRRHTVVCLCVCVCICCRHTASLAKS